MVFVVDLRHKTARVPEFRLDTISISAKYFSSKCGSRRNAQTQLAWQGIPPCACSLVGKLPSKGRQHARTRNHHDHGSVWSSGLEEQLRIMALSEGQHMSHAVCEACKMSEILLAAAMHV